MSSEYSCRSRCHLKFVNRVSHATITFLIVTIVVIMFCFCAALITMNCWIRCAVSTCARHFYRIVLQQCATIYCLHTKNYINNVCCADISCLSPLDVFNLWRSIQCFALPLTIGQPIAFTAHLSLAFSILCHV